MYDFRLDNKEITMKVKQFVRVVLLLVLGVVGLFVGQGASVQAQTSGPDYQKMAGLVGDWTSEGQGIDSPFGPAGTQSIKITSRWFPGEFAVVRHLDGTKSASGEYHGLQILTYDKAAKDYPWHWFDNTGSAGVSRVMITDGALIETYESKAQGKTYKIRGRLSGLGSDRLMWVQEYSEDGKVWTPYYHSVDTRVK
jgi:Protein of unknown function (DUF1579)